MELRKEVPNSNIKRKKKIIDMVEVPDEDVRKLAYLVYDVFTCRKKNVVPSFYFIVEYSKGQAFKTYLAKDDQEMGAKKSTRETEIVHTRKVGDSSFMTQLDTPSGGAGTRRPTVNLSRQTYSPSPFHKMKEFEEVPMQDASSIRYDDDGNLRDRLSPTGTLGYSNGDYFWNEYSELSSTHKTEVKPPQKSIKNLMRDYHIQLANNEKEAVPKLNYDEIYFEYLDLKVGDIVINWSYYKWISYLTLAHPVDPSKITVILYLLTITVLIELVMSVFTGLVIFTATIEMVGCRYFIMFESLFPMPFIYPMSTLLGF
jgi:hypothetical protein